MSIIDKIFGSKHGSRKTSSKQEFSTHLLKLLIKRHTPATIKFKGHDQTFVTMIIGIDETEQTLQLDEFTPKEGHKMAMEENPFVISSSDRGVPLQFKSQIIGSGIEDDIPYYIIPLPKKIDYKQRRESFRLNTELEKLNCHFNFKEEEIKNAVISDISFTGLSMHFNECSFIDLIEPNIELDTLNFIGYEDLKIQCQFRVCHIGFDSVHKRHTIGGAFLNLTKEQQRNINHYVSYLQREILRRNSREF